MGKVLPRLGRGQGMKGLRKFRTAAFSIQRQLPGQILLDVGYVWTKGTHLSSRLMNSNVVPTVYQSLRGRSLQEYC